MPRTVGIVPHTHWDREWYAPFQTFRLLLVQLLDSLLPLLEGDPSYVHFLLDGQTVVLDDYLEVRPEVEGVLRRLAASGRISLGPWMVLMDEYMVSGETIVRDLQLGLARANELGGANPVGYLPDMFGHVAQMPQLLRSAGLEHTVVWRGVPEAVDRTGFWWEAPDGSRVRAEYLIGSYSNGRDLPQDAAGLVTRARDYATELGSACIGDLLLMNGTDHQAPQPWLGRLVAEANAAQDDFHFAVTSLADYVARQPTDGLDTWRGELRSGARSNVLMGVASNRVDIHRACAAAERAIERRAEPLCALLVAPERYPQALLAIAWRNLVLNSAHDSSCACSADEVVDQVAVRYAEARQIGDGLAREALHALAREVDVPAGSTLVVNPTGKTRSGLVEGLVAGSGPLHFVDPEGIPRAAQVVTEHGGEAYSATVPARDVRSLLDFVRGPDFAGFLVASHTTQTAPDGLHEIVLQQAAPGEATVDLSAVREEMSERAARGLTQRVRILRAPSRTVLIDSGPVAGFGWTTLQAVDGARPPGGVVATEGALANELLRVAIDSSDGSYTIETNDGLRLGGLGRLVDGGDGGDTYNYSPPAADRIVERPDRVILSTLETGPLRARLLVTSDYSWPAHAVGDQRSCSRRADETVTATVRTTLELRTGEPFLRVSHEIDNRARDHRLRAHFPLPSRVDGSDAECAFAVVHRGLTAEGGPQEVGLPTFVSRRFVDATDGKAGLALLHDGLLEYEVVDDGGELALTLLRCVGYLSRAEPSLRPNAAGPLLAVEGAQMQGLQVAEYAVLPHRGDWRAADLHGASDAFLVPLERVRGGGVAGAHRPAAGAALRVAGAEVSAVLRGADGPLVRLFRTAETEGPVEVEYEGAPARGSVVDLAGRRIESFEGKLLMRPWQIVTLVLTAD